ncbi:nuclear transport factor 2 family protein [Flavisphingomonas formosensis]|uniref:nuclear transport factor 2 family protein n=1 Tax=Flavisphingomonas formosensis TaxID=861534 RepID=UPI0012FC2C11|nr:nuclear transport factor 2 family protein [Sphingomonas formosensis]
MTVSARNHALIEALQASWADPDPESFVALFTPDGIFEDIPYAIRLVGHDALRTHARRMKKHSVGLSVALDRYDATASTGVAEWRLSHVYAGNFDGVDCTGRPVAIRGLSIYFFSGGLITRAADYWNYMELVRTMEVIPREVRGMRVQ